MGHPYWPLFDLRVRTPRLELRLPTDDELVELHFRLDRRRWEGRDRPEVAIEGLEGCRELFGALATSV